MQKAKDIIGLPVIEIEKGEQTGSVKDFLLNDNWEIQAIVLEGKHWFSSTRIVEWEEIISFGKDAVTIENEKVIEHLDDVYNQFHPLYNGEKKILGLPILTVNGHELGMVDDVYFGGKMGRKIIGYELTDGLISDIQDGRKWLRAPKQITVGKDAIIVPVQSEQDLENSWINSKG
ncbi:PRC-barrel domain-containing protein [Chengkuizengella axinellae]|uniref:PRC-barrel domain-containing protein n=1 Tax=Chengkuizengella axinellae TaxID=3064388 RepID=A0ABT9IU09_9BACL|nr:PRC-barrel domain-containing protein [Chengkuizengella sp. 2205SS18-9]MDP5272802.1 PRC-barrel domain-containing protein [Chengkuizengella sp. 2205SS18-9]